MSDLPADPPDPSAAARGPGDPSVEIDLAAFLPEGSSLAGGPAAPEGAGVDGAEDDDVDDGWGPEPEVPAWARDDEAGAGTEGADADPIAADPVVDAGADAPIDAGIEPGPGSEPATQAAAGEAEPAPPSRPAVDVSVLTRIEAELAAVDDALVALDQGDLSRSPLLVAFVGASPDAPAAAPAPPVAAPSAPGDGAA